jgi:hypothetical protein
VDFGRARSTVAGSSSPPPPLPASAVVVVVVVVAVVIAVVVRMGWKSGVRGRRLAGGRCVGGGECSGVAASAAELRECRGRERTRCSVEAPARQLVRKRGGEVGAGGGAVLHRSIAAAQHDVGQTNHITSQGGHKGSGVTRDTGRRPKQPLSTRGSPVRGGGGSKAPYPAHAGQRHRAECPTLIPGGGTDLHAARPTRGAHHCREVPRKDDTTATFSLRLEKPKIRFVSCMEFSKKRPHGVLGIYLSGV